MIRKQRPAKLVLINCAVAADGGSLLLEALDPAGSPIAFLLDQSVRRQIEGTNQLYVDGAPILRGSPEEAGWLTLLCEAKVEKPSGSSRPASGEAAILSLRTHLVALVASAEYQAGRAPEVEVASTPPDRVRSLTMEGKTLDAIRAYREAHPDTSMMTASLEVKAMAADVERATHSDPAHAGAPRLAPSGDVPRE